MDEPRVTVPPDALADAIAVWLKVMPKSLWSDLEAHYIASQQKRQGERPMIERAVAEYLAAQFHRAKWEATHPRPVNVFSDSAT